MGLVIDFMYEFKYDFITIFMGPDTVQGFYKIQRPR